MFEIERYDEEQYTEFFYTHGLNVKLQVIYHTCSYRMQASPAVNSLIFAVYSHG